MNKKTLSIIALVAIVIAFIAACSKTNPTVFTWDYDSFHYVADSAYSPASQNPNTIISAYSGYRVVEIHGANKLNVGTYTLGGTNTGTYLFYYSVGIVFDQSGTLNVTYNDNTKMSGSFSANLTDGTSISGSFTDIPIR